MFAYKCTHISPPQSILLGSAPKSKKKTSFKFMNIALDSTRERRSTAPNIMKSPFWLTANEPEKTTKFSRLSAEKTFSRSFHCHIFFLCFNIWNICFYWTGFYFAVPTTSKFICELSTCCPAHTSNSHFTNGGETRQAQDRDASANGTYHITLCGKSFN